MAAAEPSPRRRLPRWALPLLKVLVAAVVLLAVGRTLTAAARGLQDAPVRPAAGLAVASGAVYALAFLPMGLYWRRVLQAWGQPSGLGPVVQAYYLGHLGKYVPGKALVVVLRTGSLRAAGGQTAAIAASVFVETLTLMALGGVLSGVLLTIPRFAAGQPAWLVVVAFGLAAGSLLPICPPVMNRLIAFYEARRQDAPAAEPHRLSWGLFAAGWLAAAVTWCGLGASLWLAVRSCLPGFELSINHWLACLLAAALPVVAGFLSLIPGGLLVRDGLMVALLTPTAGPEVALAATVLVRLAWIGSEAVVCGILVAAARVVRLGG
ncbi:hypothetical protein KOR34_25060 [Posidoniimonas corsicana]|uniref:Flippase-like domain-containing protein n=1 Tax=Posidoniimonas corsicana TaxID=1938618 RepID=A0A5C5VHS2_9BACT|nr:lysylphosphatidylglycerol synthase domain-containing protein [Posidoniimonas corsicana]TWT37553.1 hypothetical protein KOR34_25060 [Posidoniimonas corsicana]